VNADGQCGNSGIPLVFLSLFARGAIMGGATRQCSAKSRQAERENQMEGLMEWCWLC